MTYGYDFELTQEQILFIKNIRTVHNYSWGAVAREFCDRWPGFTDKNNKRAVASGPCGAALCDTVMKELKEDVEDGWN